ncbi:MAG: hypothetical protein LBF25_00885 [Puniceicoccales bacterium]|jgi:type II secretory pathway predicted ATPase ExeA|nr:hypothetical protein [Puniceicoccales bacterium]
MVMYLKFFRLKEKSFKIETDASCLYVEGQCQTALSLLKCGVAERGGFTVVTGEVCCGESPTCQALLNGIKALKSIVILLDNPPSDECEMLIEICMELGVEHTENLPFGKSEDVSRIINNLCGEAMLSAFVNSSRMLLTRMLQMPQTISGN